MAAPDERTGLLKAASPLESVARDKATSGEHKDHHPEVESRVMQVAAELVEALESTSKNDKLQESGAALLAAQIRSNLRTPDQLIILAYLLILPLFERPLWCFFDSHCGKDVNVPDSGMPRLPWAGSVAIDLAVLLFCASLLALRIVSNGWAKLARSPWRIAELVLVSVGLLDVLLIYAVRHEAVLWIPFIRPLLFVVKNSNVQSVVQQLIMAAPQVANVLFLLAINIFLFGWLGVLLFWKTDCDPNKAGNQGCSVNPQFTALGQSFQNLYISLAFANILDLIRDSKAAKPVWVLYMFAFVVSSIWILQSLVLAVIYNVYRKTEEERKKEKEERVKNELKAAFKRLDVAGKGYLETAVIKQLFEAFGRLHLTTHITATQFDLMYDLLDANNDDQVQEEEFLEVFDVLNMRFKKKRTPKKFFHDCLHFFYKSSWYQVFEASIKSNVFEYIIDAFVALTALLLFIQTIYLLKNKDTVIFTDLDLIVTIFFTIQLLLKLVAYGPHEFWDRLYFRFDLLVTVLMVVAEIVQHASPSSNSRTIVRWVMVLRVLGVVRLLSHFKTFVLVFTSLRKLQKQIPTLALSFFVLLAFFSVVGMMSFGGIIKCVPSGNDNNSTTVPPLYLFGDEDLPSCDDDDLHYLATLNFNDLYNSICTLFAVMTSGDWTNIVHPILDRTSQWGQIYFYAFYILVNLAVLNLFVGFVIDSFLDTFKETEAAEEDMSKWKARMKKGNLEKMEGQQEEIERIN